MTTWRFKQTAKSRSLSRIDIGNIHIPRGRRPVDPAKRDALAESIKIGTETPITVRRINRAVRCEGKSFWELVAGNRLAPCKKRGIGKSTPSRSKATASRQREGRLGRKAQAR
jgi:hypothetical protein